MYRYIDIQIYRYRSIWREYMYIYIHIYIYIYSTYWGTISKKIQPIQSAQLSIAVSKNPSKVNIYINIKLN